MRGYARFIAWTLASAAVILGLLAAAPPSAAHQGSARWVNGLTVSETVTLPEDTWVGYTFFLGSGDRLEYDITVFSGLSVDMYIVPADGLKDYRGETATSFRCFADAEDRRVIIGTFTSSSATEGVTTVVIDNARISGAMPTGDVGVYVSLEWTVAPEPSPLPLAGAAVAVIAGVAVAVVVVVLRGRKRAPHLRRIPKSPPPSGP